MADLTFTLVQTALHWEDKDANRRMLEEKMNRIAEPTQVVVLPEMFSTGFSMRPDALAEGMDGETVRWLKGVAAAKRVIIAGSFIAAEEGSYYNRLLWVLPNGELGHYDKRHLFAFAGEDRPYTAGNQRVVASVNGWRVNLQVCYDLRFPVWARQQPQPDRPFEYDVLLYVANWPARRSLAWRTLLQARAIENQCYVIGVNRVGADGNGIAHSGDSTVIDPLGEVLYHKADEEDLHTLTLRREVLDAAREKFPFWRDADRFALLF